MRGIGLREASTFDLPQAPGSADSRTVVRLTPTQLEALVEFAAKFPGCTVELSDWTAVLKALSAAARSATTAPANAPSGHSATAE
jgi:hypothetical protein